MEIAFKHTPSLPKNIGLIILGSYKSNEAAAKKTRQLSVLPHWPDEYKKTFAKLSLSTQFTGEKGEKCFFNLASGKSALVVGLGVKESLSLEGLRKTMGQLFHDLKGHFYPQATLHLDSFLQDKNEEKSLEAMIEGLALADYRFDKYLGQKKVPKLQSMTLWTQQKEITKWGPDLLRKCLITCQGVYLTRDFINEVPNELNSEVFAKRIEQDARENLPQVKINILKKAQIQKENMHLLLAVNKASAFEPRVVHLVYKPKSPQAHSKHIALVGKGLTFDTGGYSLKPAASMVGMKFDMGGAATVYGAFRNAVLLNSPHTISCYLGITDNVVASDANLPDSVIYGRSGKSVEILNTDAEGRLVLADCLDYACDSKPDFIIDAATLTGACIAALDTVCGLMGNSQNLIERLMKAAEAKQEKIWHLPIFDEYREDIKSDMADIKNLSGNKNAGAQKAAAFLEHFIRNKTPWAHLDIAGIAGSVKGLPYCAGSGASGLMVRTLTHFLVHETFNS